ncbi:MAG: hypothetical protein N2202_05885 [Proteobacteria bacterium]|nr:hypothetical protein [Pseudomonadota bacterium]
MNVFIYRKGALGDTVAFLPFLFRLRTFYKKIFFAGNYLFRDLFHDIDFIEFVDADSKGVFECLKGCIPKHFEGISKFYIFSNLLDCNKKNFFYFKPLTEDTWFYKYPFDCLNMNFVPIPIFLPINYYEDLEGYILKKTIIIHPGSGGLKKVWPIENFFEFEELVKKYNFNCIYILGESEERLIDKMNGRKFLYNLPLKKVCFLLTYALAYLGCDSGITHLAGILNMRGLALFGPSNDQVYKPWGDIKVIKGKNGSLENIKPKDVFNYFKREDFFEGR